MPLVRYEIYNTGAGYGSLPVALGNSRRPTEYLSTVSANFYITNGVVLKADYRHYQHDQQPDKVTHYSLGNLANLGMASRSERPMLESHHGG